MYIKGMMADGPGEDDRSPLTEPRGVRSEEASRSKTCAIGIGKQRQLADPRAQSPAYQGIDPEDGPREIETHRKLLHGTRLVSGLTRRDIRAMQIEIAAGKGAPNQKLRLGSQSTGRAGGARQAIGTSHGHGGMRLV